MRDVISALVLVAALGCAPEATVARPASSGGDAGPAEPQHAPASARSVAPSPRVPMTVEWVVQRETPERLTLVARVNRNAPLKVPATVTVTVPAGVRLVSGRTSWVVPASESRGPVDEVLVFEVVQPGAQQILLAADAVGANFGVHAKKAYTLGQAAQAPARKAAAPPASAPPLEVGGRDFGESVPVQP